MEKKQQIPGLNAESRTRGMLKGFDESVQQQIPPPPNYIQSQQQIHPGIARSPSSVTMMPQPMKLPLDPQYDLDDYDSEDEDEDPHDPFVKSCCFCCNLGIGVILGALFFLLYDGFFVISKSAQLFTEDRAALSSMDFGMQTASVILNAFSVIASFILMACACLCGTPERSTSMRFLNRYWMFTIGLNTVFQVIETLVNTLPDPDSIFVVSMPKLGFPEIMGPPAIIITWSFTSVYMFVYLYMCLVGISYTRELNVKQYKRATKYESKVNRRIAAQLPSFDDIQSNTTYMERLSDLSREMSDEVYQEVAPSDMTGLDDIYARKSGIKRSPSPRLLQAQLAYLSPQQRVQFLQQLQSQPMPAGLQMGGPPLPQPPVQQKPQTDTDSQISSGSKPNSNGYNVRFGPDTKPDPSELAEAKQQHMAQVMQQMMHDQMMQQAVQQQRLSPTLQAPPFGPRPPCYETGIPQMMTPQQQMMTQQQQMMNQQMMNQQMMSQQMHPQMQPQMPQGPSGQPIKQ